MQIKEIDKKHVEAKLYGNIGGFFTDGNSFSSLLEAAAPVSTCVNMQPYGLVSFYTVCYPSFMKYL